MVTKVPENKKRARLLAPTGMQQAVCYGVWDIGIQEDKRYNKKSPKAFLAFELKKTIEQEGDLNGKRYTISKKYTLSDHEKARLSIDISSWFGKKFEDGELRKMDLEELIGKNCLLNIVHNVFEGETYSNIEAITPLMEGLSEIEPETSPEPPEWVQKMDNRPKFDDDLTNEASSQKEDGNTVVEDDDFPFSD